MRYTKKSEGRQLLSRRYAADLLRLNAMLKLSFARSDMGSFVPLPHPRN